MTSKSRNESSLRASVTFPAEIYVSLEKIAKKKKVSLAWVIRDAAEKYVSEQWPLFAGSRGSDDE
jgi:metal-responsive CopG/Arc/MetJ family transcriptional regulator